MAIAATNIETSFSAASASSYATGSFTPVRERLYLLWVHSDNTAAGSTNPTVSGAGLTWVQVDTLVFAVNAQRRISLFRARGPAPSTGALTIDFAGNSQDRIGISLIELTGADITGPNGAGAIVQDITGSLASNNTSMTLTLANAIKAGNATAGGIGLTTLGAAAITHGSGYTEMGQAGDAAQTIESQFKAAGTTTVDWTFANTAPAAIGVEIKAFSPAPDYVRRPYRTQPRLHRGSSWLANPTGASQTGLLQSVTAYVQPTIDGSRRPIPRQHRGGRWFAVPGGVQQFQGVPPTPGMQTQALDGSRKPIPRQHRAATWFGNRSGLEQFQGISTPPSMQQQFLEGSRKPIPRQHRPARWFPVIAVLLGTQPSMGQQFLEGSRKPIPRQHRAARWVALPLAEVAEFEGLSPPSAVVRPSIYSSRWPIPRQHRGARWLTNKSGIERNQGLFPPAQVYRQPQRSSRWPIPRQHRGARWWPNLTGTFTAGFTRPAQLGSHCRPILEIAFTNTVIDEPPTWVDISSRLRQQGVHPRRGRSQELQQFSAGKLSATLDDRDRAFDPLNTLSPYYPNVDINKPVRMRGEYPWLPGLVPNPNFGGDDGSGSLVGWSPYGTGTTNLDPGNAYLGSVSCLFTATANQVEAGPRSDPFPVAGGQYAVFSARVLPAAGTHSYAIKVEWFSDLAGTVSMGTVYGAFLSASAGSWKRLMSTAAQYVPNSAMSARIAVVQSAVTNGDAFDIDTVVFDYGTFQGIFPIWYGYLDKLTPKVEGLDRVTELSATDAFSLLTLSTLSSTGYSDLVEAGFVWDILSNIRVPTNYWRMGDVQPSFGLHDEMGLSDLTILGSVTGGQPGALPADVDTSTQFQANPGGTAVSVGALLTHSTQAGAFECWLKWTDTGQTLLPFVGIASQQTILFPLFGWASSPLLIAMAGDGAVDNLGNPVPRGSLCMFSYARTGGVDHWAQWWMKGPTGRIKGDGHWHHIMLKFSGNDAYIDGVWAAPGMAQSSSLPTGVDFGAAGLADQSFILSPTTFLGQTMEGVSLWDNVQGWDGFIDEAALYDYSGGPLTVGPTALAHYKAGAGQWANQTPGQRVNSVLDTIGWPSARRTVGIDSAPQLQPVDATLTQANALSYLQSIESNDLGYLLMGADGTVTFLTRQQLVGAGLGSVQAVFGNEAVLNSSETPYELAEPFLDQMILFNKAEVQQTGGATFIYKDAASVNKYWERTVQATGMLMANIVDAVYMAQWLVLHYKAPETRIEPLVLNPLNDDRVWKAALNLDVGELVEVRDRMRVASGYRSYIARVQGVNIDVTSDKWVFNLSLASADAQRFFTLNDPSLGTLSSGNRLGW